MGKLRLDKLLLHGGICSDIDAARRLIGAGEVKINGELADKAGELYPLSSEIKIKEKCPYVSRGGYKLQGGLDSFAIDPEGLICVDVGASTGGFTDCLLQRGARTVYAVDVAYGMLDWKLRQDKRVISIERFNARKLSSKEISEPVDLAVIDAAFISLTKLIPPLLPLFRDNISIICLIKPQFELPRSLIPAGGVVVNDEHHLQAVEKIISFCTDLGLHVSEAVPSPILGPKGNKEFLINITG